MKHRNFHIAWSVAWGVVAVLLVVLWIRSYWWFDWLDAAITPGHSGIGVQSAFGKFRVLMFYDSVDPIWWSWNASKLEGFVARSAAEVIGKSKLFDTSVRGAFVVTVPQWLGVFAVTLIAALPWLPLKRFSLRTLLIATTLFALVLGLIVWMSRAG
jgi:hypothetical protein